MADLIIRGMSMPHDCPHCEFAAIGFVSPMTTECTLYCRAVDKFKDCATAVIKEKSYADLQKYDSRPSWCPLVPLPEGRGRLVDADALMDVIHSHDYPLTAHFNSTDNGMFTVGIQQAVDEAPTIVPAEGGNADEI